MQLWRGGAAGFSVVVAAVTGVVTNLVTDRWSLALVVSLGLLVVLGVALQVGLTLFGDHNREDRGPDKHFVTGVQQQATARDNATIIQAGRDAHQAEHRPGRNQ